MLRKIMSAALMLPTIAIEQEAVPEAPTDEIVVTAMKREAALQDIGAAITAIGGEEVKLKGIESGVDLQFHVPNMVYSVIGGSAMYSIRGVGLSVDSGLAEPGVAVHLDGAFLARASQTVLMSGDIERLEVLRGPQGTLYGRNATGGVINFITNSPSEELSLGVNIEGAERARFAVNGFVSGPIWGENWLGRLYADHKQYDGYVENLETGDDDRGDMRTANFRITNRFHIGHDLTVDLVGRYSRQRTKSGSAQLVQDLTGTFVDLGVGTIERDKTRADKAAPFAQDIYGVTLTARYEGPGFDIKTITSYVDEALQRSNDIDGTSLNMFFSTNWQDS